jgi:hypothetical protein
LHDEACAAYELAEQAFHRALSAKPTEPTAALYSEEGIAQTIDDIKTGKVDPMKVWQTLANSPLSPEWTAYDTALKAWKNDEERLRRETGLDDADTASEDACHAWGLVRDRIAAISATTLDGVLFKVRLHAATDDPDMVESIINDLLALWGGTPCLTAR